MKIYNYKNCQSLFGYSAEVHIRCKGKCQLCGYGREPLDFDMWRQMTVEHLIGKSQGGYLKQIRESVKMKFPEYQVSEVEVLSKKIDALNTVTACQFCNSTTSRDESQISMGDLITDLDIDHDSALQSIEKVCLEILKKKKEKVEWKLQSVKKAFHAHVSPQIS